MNEETFKRISVTATIEFGPDTATVRVKRVDGEGLSTESHKIQTIMMLVTGKALNEMVAEFGQGDEEVSPKTRLKSLPR